MVSLYGQVPGGLFCSRPIDRELGVGSSAAAFSLTLALTFTLISGIFLYLFSSFLISIFSKITGGDVRGYDRDAARGYGMIARVLPGESFTLTAGAYDSRTGFDLVSPSDQSCLNCVEYQVSRHDQRNSLVFKTGMRNPSLGWPVKKFCFERDSGYSGDESDCWSQNERSSASRALQVSASTTQSHLGSTHSTQPSMSPAPTLLPSEADASDCPIQCSHEEAVSSELPVCCFSRQACKDFDQIVIDDDHENEVFVDLKFVKNFLSFLFQREVSTLFNARSATPKRPKVRDKSRCSALKVFSKLL